MTVDARGRRMSSSTILLGPKYFINFMYRDRTDFNFTSFKARTLISTRKIVTRIPWNFRNFKFLDRDIGEYKG